MTTTIFSGARGTGKTRKLLEHAAQYNAIVITPYDQALKVKAKAYGIDVEIINPIEYTQNYKESYRARKIAVVNAAEVLQYFVNYNQCGNELIGMTVNE